MEDWNELIKMVENRTKILSENVESTKTELLGIINQAKNDEIFVALGRITTRLDRIEARLPEPDPE